MRKPDKAYLNNFRELKNINIFKNSTILGLKFRRGTIRDYIFILQPQQVIVVKDCFNSLMDSKWKEHFIKLRASALFL